MHRWVEHTGELELEIEAPTEEAVVADAVAAMAELLDAAGGDERRAVAVEAPDRARLLAELLAELAFLAETEGFVPAAFEALDARDGRLEATVRGASGATPPHLVKAVTLYRLAFAPDGDGGGWRARVVMDV